MNCNSNRVSGGARVVWVLAGLGMMAAPARGEFVPVATGGKEMKVPLNYPVGSTVTITTTGTASGKGEPPKIASHTHVVTKAGLNFNVPKSEASDATGQIIQVRDYTIQVVPPPQDNDDMKSILDVESFDPTYKPNGEIKDFLQNAVSDELYNTLGDGVALRIPIFSDVGGQFLYAAINIDAYIPNQIDFNHLPPFFEVENGRSADLPGMVFGTAPILMDPGSADGFGFSAITDEFSGSLRLAAETDPSASAPLPSVLGTGLALLGGFVVVRSRVGGRVRRVIA